MYIECSNCKYFQKHESEKIPFGKCLEKQPHRTKSHETGQPEDRERIVCRKGSCDLFEEAEDN